MIKNKFINNYNFKNKLIYIFGGSGLIGNEVSSTLSNLGAKIINLDIKKNKTKKKNIVFYNFDCKKYDENFKIKLLIKKFGCPDILINCSYARTDDWTKNNFADCKLSSFKKNIDYQLNFICWSSHIIANEMKKRKINGKIILLNSIYGIRGQDLNIYKGSTMRENMTYSIAKGGITNFVRQMCSYYAKYNLHINSVISGGLKGHTAGSSKNQNKKFLKNYSVKCPMKRLGKVEEVSNLIVYLSSNASNYINGSNIVIDGGMTSI